MPENLLPDYLQKAQEEAQKAAETATELTSSLYSVPIELRKALTDKMRGNEDLIRQKNKAQAEYFKTPAAAREPQPSPGSSHPNSTKSQIHQSAGRATAAPGPASVRTQSDRSGDRCLADVLRWVATRRPDGPGQ